MNFRYLTHIFCTLFFVTSLTMMTSCDKTDDEDIPSYISIDSISLNSQYQQGTSSHKITDAWVYVNNKLIGAFELPDTIPVLASGPSKVVIYPGVRMNGVASTRIPYPFYNFITYNPVNLVREKVYPLGKITATYNSETVVAWNEDFESNNFSIDTTQNTDVKLIRTNDEDKVFKYPDETSHYSALAEFTGDSTVFESVSHSSFELPQDGTAVFLELNYKTNTPLTIGVYGRTATYTEQQAVFVLNPNTAWNKIYINLTPTVTYLSACYDFRIYFKAMKSEDIDQAEILLDNIKLLHF
ncbi:MAG TPA: hypothetical protein PLJ84_02710 [Bacteroidales bacterium]|nr:hypothetical protein [Bacteroidales bacterium]